ncbi:hypothetical protein BCU68_01135 [Vibrio sp. 10N.286.49.B3]|uniref:lipocalin-like domain-containing protein n=1 Tax=Vibrio sp. 10N.286.49.B3 TaxID=1880855 RepID=UPI000C827F58|nr:lipocalin-like domain-containing protein [Vibrio sp. 10N.286.49.B3]PMH46668.1 hypothetical protein BCU68_01135 [Vibrio sp. 10N.286.49.B3]
MQMNRFKSNLLTVLIVALVISLIFSVYILVSPDRYDEVQARESETERLEEEDQVTFDPVLPGYEISLPKDFQLHSGFQYERWQYFASLKGSDGKRYTAQWNYYRVALDEREGKGWQNPNIFASNIIITAEDKVWREQRLSRAGIGQAGMQNRPFRLWIDNWSWRSMNSTPFPGHLDIQSDDFEVELFTTNAGAYVLNADKGYQQQHDFLPIASYSFAAPYLQTKGVLEINNEEITVSGPAWIYKEWGSDQYEKPRLGSDRFVIPLDDNQSITLNRYRYKNQKPYLSATLSNRLGEAIALKDEDIMMTPLITTTLDNGVQLPLHWAIKIPDYGIHLTVRTKNKEQWHPLLLPGWQGEIITSGSHRVVGFMQLSGY